MRKLPASTQWLVFPAVLALFMTCIVSGISIWRVRGIGAGFIDAWLPAWGTSWLVAFPVLMLVQPLVGRLVGLLVERPGR
jgi:Protein of unknown function (DUF2798)